MTPVERCRVVARVMLERHAAGMPRSDTAELMSEGLTRDETKHALTVLEEKKYVVRLKTPKGGFAGARIFWEVRDTPEALDALTAIVDDPLTAEALIYGHLLPAVDTPIAATAEEAEPEEPHQEEGLAGFLLQMTAVLERFSERLDSTSARMDERLARVENAVAELARNVVTPRIEEVSAAENLLLDGVDRNTRAMRKVADELYGLAYSFGKLQGEQERALTTQRTSLTELTRVVTALLLASEESKGATSTAFAGPEPPTRTPEPSLETPPVAAESPPTPCPPSRPIPRKKDLGIGTLYVSKEEAAALGIPLPRKLRRALRAGEKSIQLGGYDVLPEKVKK